MINELAKKVAGANSIMVLTGAGMSAESGVPTFRDAQTGYWAKFSPQDLATPEAFANNPKLVWRWYQERRQNLSAVTPNAGHKALAQLQALTNNLTIVTQNVDGLHQAAGSSEVIELHGNISRTICSRTRKPILDVDDCSDELVQSPHHPDGLGRPDVVWFGEALPVDAIEQALSVAGRVEVTIVVGTSAEVEPAASLPRIAAANGAFIADINPNPNPLSNILDIQIQDTAARSLPALVQAVKTIKSSQAST